MLTMLCWVLTSLLLATLSSLAEITASSCTNTNCRGTSCNNGHHDSTGQSNILRKMLKAYDHHLIPSFGKGKQTEVVCDVYINSFDSISVDTMDYQVDIYMRQRWKDPRLAYGHLEMNISRLSLDHRMYHSIWVPDLFFPNEKSSHVHCVTVPNSMIRIHPDGSILYSARYTLRLACHMSLERFPLDTQTCHMKIESYGYTQDEIHLAWLNETNVDGVQINDALELPQFDLEKVTWGTCNDSYIIGSFACLEATFSLRRQYGYYMIQTYVPSILIVTLSWTSFWINMDAIPARISLGVLTVLTLTTQCVGVWMSLPRVSYIKAIDVWMAMCIVSVFSAMLEFATVNTLSRKEIRRITIRANAQAKDPRTATDTLKRMIEEYNYGKTKPLDGGSRMIARRVDKVARWLFPIAFVIFNVIYWSYYLI